MTLNFAFFRVPKKEDNDTEAEYQRCKEDTMQDWLHPKVGKQNLDDPSIYIISIHDYMNDPCVKLSK